MKQLSIEQKAKRYDEAIKLAKDSFNYPDYPGFIRADVVFPEIKESEDERIRKEIIATIHLYYGEPLEDEAKEMIAWIEKQGVKPDWWNDKDEEIRQELIEMIKEDWPGRSDVIAWIEKQKERNTNTHLPSFDEAQGTPIVKQGEKKPAEWTFEAKGWDKEQIQKCITWLQSLRPQNTWKPSTFQIEALESATENCAYSEYQDCLRELAKQLKELREE